MIQNNNIPQGYKDSPLGIIPEEWAVRRLGEVSSTFKSGNGITAEHIFESGEFSVYGGNGFRGYTNDYTHEGNYVLIGRQGALCGNVNFVSGKNYVSEHAIAFQPHGDNCINFWYFYLGYMNLNKFSESSAQPGLSVEKLLKLKICVPPLSEQQKIAEILTVWDNAIDIQTRLIAFLQKRKQGIMQQLLTREKRLQGFEGEWREVTIGEIGEISSAGVDKKIVDGEIPIRLVNFLDVYRRDFIYSNELNHWVTANKDKITKCTVKKGDIFFTPSSEVQNDIGLSAVAMEDIPDAVYSYHIVRLRLFEDWDLKYRAYAFKTDEFYKQAETLCDGSGQRYVISQSNFRNMTVKVPPNEEQAAIAKILFFADKEIDLAKKKLANLKAQKKGLMQQLLTGKKRMKL